MQVKIETSFCSLNVEMSEEDARKLMRYVCEHAERHETLETKRNNDLLKEKILFLFERNRKDARHWLY